MKALQLTRWSDKLMYLFFFMTAGMNLGCSQSPREQTNNQNLTTSDIIIHDPVSYKGLQIFQVSLKNTASDLSYLTLAEAISEKKLTVEETSNVNQLTISNNSDRYVFIMSGDIIKGGKQDRTIGVDAIIPPHAKNLPIDSYCVESGRWQQRGNENVEKFSENTKSLSSRELKLASKYKKDQGEVWQNVAKQQQKLNKTISEYKGEDVDIRSDQSESSLQLTLENEDLNEIIKEYKDNLSKVYSGNTKANGFAYAINGELYGIDLFNDPELFKQLSGKLYESAIVEAISEYSKENTQKQLAKEDVLQHYSYDFKKRTDNAIVNEVTEFSTYDSDDKVLFKTENSAKKQWIHKNLIPKNEYADSSGQNKVPSVR